MAIAFDIKDPENQRLLGILMVFALVIFGYYYFMVKPKQLDLAARKAEIATLQNQLNTMRGNLQEKKRLEVEKLELGEKLAELESYLPEQENVSLLLDQFSTVENATKVYVVGFKASEVVEESGKLYQAIKYNITVEAGYHQFVQFMGGVMALPRILSFSELKIGLNPNVPAGEKVNEGLEDQPRSLSIECSITSYVFRDLEKKPADVKGNKT